MVWTVTFWGLVFSLSLLHAVCSGVAVGLFVACQAWKGFCWASLCGIHRRGGFSNLATVLAQGSGI